MSSSYISILAIALIVAAGCSEQNGKPPAVYVSWPFDTSGALNTDKMCADAKRAGTLTPAPSSAGQDSNETAYTGRVPMPYGGPAMEVLCCYTSEHPTSVASSKLLSPQHIDQKDVGYLEGRGYVPLVRQ